MRQIDKLVAVLLGRGGAALLIEAGQPIRLRSDNGDRPMTKEPATAGQVRALLTDVIPEELARSLAAGRPVDFPYTAPDGAVTVTVRPGPDAPSVLIRPGTPAAEAAGAAEPAPAAAATPARPAVRGGTDKIDALLRDLAESGGSDLHLRVGEPPIVRKDGVLQRRKDSPLAADDISGMLHSIMSARDRESHDGTGDADFAYELREVARFRVNAAVDRNGPMAVFRTIPSDIPTCEDVGVPQAVQDLCLLTKGLVVVTGPTGSGKSTTLAAMVDKMNREREDHILTIEDPVEFVHKSRKCLVTHRQVGEHTESFKSGLRAALREDPDIILIGELRDLETVAIAIETAETGHLVFGTLHTTTAASTVERIVDQFPGDRQAQIRVMLSESLRGVVAQTLLRRIGGGRVAAREILLTTPAVSNLIREGKTFQIPSVMQTSKKIGMVTLNDSLMELVDQKIVDPKEAYMKAVDKPTFLSGLKTRGIDTSFVG
jgi:twitching motility protein PilT